MKAPSSNDEASGSRSSQKSTNPLQRGSACLSCRKRKMKCDATKPTCRQCIRANRADECEYDDGRLKSRTQILQEKIAKLENRIMELETHPESTPSLLPSVNSSPSIQSLQSYTTTLSGTPEIMTPDSLEAINSPGFPTSHSPTNSYHDSPHLEAEKRMSSGSSSGSPFNNAYNLRGESSSSSTPIHSFPAALQAQTDGAASGTDEFYTHTILSDGFDLNSLNAGELVDHRVSPANGDRLFLENASDDVSGRGISGISADSYQWWIAENLAPTDRDMLLDIFLPHSRQCGFDIHVERLRGVLNAGDTIPQPHPALLNAMYLLACHFSNSPSFTVLEPHFLARALRGISAALELSDRLVNIVQASALLSVYFFAKARLLEGYYHSSSASRLTVALGLHQIRTPVWRPQDIPSPLFTTWNGSPGSFVPLAPPASSLELGERISAFWQVFFVDRCWSVATGLPSSLPDDEHPQLHISTVWPRSIYDYETIDELSVDYTSLEALHDERQPVVTFNSIQALRGKAATFFERASRIAAMRAESNRWNQFCQTEWAITHFQETLPGYMHSSLSGDDPLSVATDTIAEVRAGVNIDLAVVHTLTHVAKIQLQHTAALKEFGSHKKCLSAAREVTTIIRQFSEFDYAYLDPIIGSCWMCASDVFIREQTWHRGPDTLEDISELSPSTELDTLIGALKLLGNIFPLALYQAEKVEQSRPVGYTSFLPSSMVPSSFDLHELQNATLM